MGDCPLTVESLGKFRFDSYTHTSSVQPELYRQVVAILVTTVKLITSSDGLCCGSVSVCLCVTLE